MIFLPTLVFSPVISSILSNVLSSILTKVLSGGDGNHVDVIWKEYCDNVFGPTENLKMLSC